MGVSVRESDKNILETIIWVATSWKHTGMIEDMNLNAALNRARVWCHCPTTIVGIGPFACLPTWWRISAQTISIVSLGYCHYRSMAIYLVCRLSVWPCCWKTLVQTIWLQLTCYHLIFSLLFICQCQFSVAVQAVGPYNCIINSAFYCDCIHAYVPSKYNDIYNSLPHFFQNFISWYGFIMEDIM